MIKHCHFLNWRISGTVSSVSHFEKFVYLPSISQILLLVYIHISFLLEINYFLNSLKPSPYLLTATIILSSKEKIYQFKLSYNLFFLTYFECRIYRIAQSYGFQKVFFPSIGRATSIKKHMQRPLNIHSIEIYEINRKYDGIDKDELLLTCTVCLQVCVYNFKRMNKWLFSPLFLSKCMQCLWIYWFLNIMDVTTPSMHLQIHNDINIFFME